MRRESETTVELATGERCAVVWNNAGVPLTNNTEFVMKSGAVGTVMAFRLAAQNQIIRLMHSTVSVSIKNANSGELSIQNAACEPHLNQFQNPGLGAYVFDEISGNLPEGNYIMEFVVKRKTGEVEFYPTGKFINFVKLTVQPRI